LNDVTSFISEDDLKDITKEIIYNETLLDKEAEEKSEDGSIYLKAPISKNTDVGKIVYKLNGDIIAEATVVSAHDVEESSIFNNIQYYSKILFENLLSTTGLIVVTVIIIIFIIITLIIRNNRRRKYNRSKYYYNNNRRY